MDLAERFEKVNEEYLVYQNLVTKRASRADIHAFLLLDQLFPIGSCPYPEGDIVSYTTHDEIYLSIDYEQLKTLSDENILELTRCGIRYDSRQQCLRMYA